jgi:hypothetical protein
MLLRINPTHERAHSRPKQLAMPVVFRTDALSTLQINEESVTFLHWQEPGIGSAITANRE